jgi:segregation and condensation protein A
MPPEELAGERITVTVPEFTGPLDLLLHLIRKNKVDLYDIPMAEVTAQYLDYLEAMQELNLEVASEFLVMASTLILIKSKMLLPRPVEEGEEEEDPREELVQRLLEYQAVRDAAERLRARGEGEEALHRREVPPPDELLGEEVVELSVSLFSLMDAFRGLLSRLSDREEVMTIIAEAMSITERMSGVLALLPEGKRLSLEDLFEEGANPSREMVVLTFLSILELLHRQVIKAYQTVPFGPIYLRRIEEGDAIPDLPEDLPGTPTGEVAG